jgi:8-oxo-(d)GTP phosphatase
MLLLRHASAVDRENWQGDDRDRPLDPRGRAQAAALPQKLENYEIDRILTSPAIRCVDTIEPLAAARGLRFEEREELSEDLHADEGLELVRSLAGEAVLVCGHGGLEEALRDQPVWRKGAVLVVDETLGVVAIVTPD